MKTQSFYLIPFLLVMLLSSCKKDTKVEAFLGIPLGVEKEMATKYIDSLHRNNILYPNKYGDLFGARTLPHFLGGSQYYLFPILKTEGGVITSMDVYLASDYNKPPFVSTGSYRNMPLYNLFEYYFKDDEFQIQDLGFGYMDTVHVADFNYPTATNLSRSIKTQLVSLYGEPISTDTLTEGDKVTVSSNWQDKEMVNITLNFEMNTYFRSKNFKLQSSPSKKISDSLIPNCILSINYSLNDKLREELKKNKVF